MRHRFAAAAVVLASLAALPPEVPAAAQDTGPYSSARPFGTLRQQAAVQQAWLKERLEVNLPAVMRAHGVDMWVVTMREYNEDFMNVHCGLTSKAVGRLKEQGRVADVVSRVGAFHVALILHGGTENPLYAGFDRLLEIAARHDVTLSLGDGLRPVSIIHATDRPQIEELLTLGELVKRAWERDVQVMVEGPGHIPLDQVEMNVKLQKRICHEAPFYVLGPLVTDIGAGYDHIVGAIGGAIAAAAGADFLCYVTPAEHLGLPSVEDVRNGLIASRIARHAADIVKGLPGARGDE